MTQQTVDLVLYAAYVIPVLPRGVVLHDAAIIIDRTRIVALLPRAEVQDRYVGVEEQYLDRHILMPGLINLHTHAPMTLFRGLGDDKVLHDWLTEDIWPMEKKFVGPELVRAGMTHAVAEMIRSGTTCFNNMYFFPDEICGVLERTGMRGAVGQGIMDMSGRLSGQGRAQSEEVCSWMPRPHYSHHGAPFALYGGGADLVEGGCSGDQVRCSDPH